LCGLQVLPQPDDLGARDRDFVRWRGQLAPAGFTVDHREPSAKFSGIRWPYVSIT
jgi:hypothetical protein